MVRVLVLVHQNVAKAPSVVGRDLGIQLQDRHGVADQVVEVDGVGRAESPLVLGVQRGDPFVVGVGILPQGRREVLVVHEFVLE